MSYKKTNHHSIFRQPIPDLAGISAERPDGSEEACRNVQYEGMTCEQLKSIAGFSGSIAHAYNNLLMAIMGSISMAQLHLEKDSQACILLKEAYKASMQAKDLTRKLITFSQMGPHECSVPSKNSRK